MAGMRDKLIHDYNNTDAEQVWRTATVEAPLVAEKIRWMIDNA